MAVREFQHGSNIFPLELGPEVDVFRLAESLTECGVVIVPDEESGETTLTVNTTILRKSRDEICGAFEVALKAGAGAPAG